jgi:hypothetical protein
MSVSRQPSPVSSYHYHHHYHSPDSHPHHKDSSIRLITLARTINCSFKSIVLLTPCHVLIAWLHHPLYFSISNPTSRQNGPI